MKTGSFCQPPGSRALLSVRSVHPFADSEKKLSFLRKSLPTHFISYRVSPVGVPTAPPLIIRPHYLSSTNTLPHFDFMPNRGLCVVDLSQDIRIAPCRFVILPNTISKSNKPRLISAPGARASAVLFATAFLSQVTPGGLLPGQARSETGGWRPASALPGPLQVAELPTGLASSGWGARASPARRPTSLLPQPVRGGARGERGRARPGAARGARRPRPGRVWDGAVPAPSPLGGKGWLSPAAAAAAPCAASSLSSALPAFPPEPASPPSPGAPSLPPPPPPAAPTRWLPFQLPPLRVSPAARAPLSASPPPAASQPRCLPARLGGRSSPAAARQLGVGARSSSALPAVGSGPDAMRAKRAGRPDLREASDARPVRRPGSLPSSPRPRVILWLCP